MHIYKFHKGSRKIKCNYTSGSLEWNNKWNFYVFGILKITKLIFCHHWYKNMSNVYQWLIAAEWKKKRKKKDLHSYTLYGPPFPLVTTDTCRDSENYLSGFHNKQLGKVNLIIFSRFSRWKAVCFHLIN